MVEFNKEEIRVDLINELTLEIIESAKVKKLNHVEVITALENVKGMVRVQQTLDSMIAVGMIEDNDFKIY